MAANKALQAKDEGNKLFKDGHLAESVKLYKEAEKYDSESAVYPSNLSAALYELGDYAGCMEAVLRSWALKPSEILAFKLSTRLAKTLSQGVQDESIGPSIIEQNAPAINELEKIAPANNVENTQAWKAWKKIRKELAFQTELSREAKIRFSRMPLYKGMPDPTLTYFVFGTDPLVSLATGWGPDNTDPINFRSLSKEQISQLSFLIAGVGDGRHGFATVLDLGKAYDTLRAPHKEHMRVYVTLLDVHFAAIARNLIYFLLIDQLLAEDLDSTTRIEIKATLVYTTIGWIMPSYCHTRLLNVLKDAESRLLKQPPNLPSWIHVDKNSIKPVIRALDFWRNNKTITCAQIVSNLTHASSGEKISQLMNSGYPGVRESMQGHRDDAERALKRVPDAALVKLANTLRWPTGSVMDYRKMLKLKNKKEEMVELMMMSQFDKNIELGLVPESLWYKQVPAFIPPPELLSCHPGFEAFNETFNSDKKADHDAKYRKIRSSVLTTWKPNMTIIDVDHAACLTITIDAFGPVQEMARFRQSNGVQMTKSNQADPESFTVFHYTAAFFDDLVQAVKSMEGKFRLELICGEVNSELSKIASGTDNRPTDFPKKFTRAWLSNIPDYTHGTLATAIHVLPALQDSVDCAGVSSNCMFNSPVWKNDDEFCYNYCMLLPRDLERYLGITTLNGKAVHDMLTLAPSHLPRPLNALASRENLQSWLSRLLLSFVAPGTVQARPNTIKLPSNLVTFVKLLTELRHVGYPSHWLSEFMNTVLQGTLQVDHMAYQNTLPRPVTEQHKRVALHRVRLDPWYAELETILASIHHGLPFALQLPEGFATTADEIGLFKAEVFPSMIFSSPMIALPKNESVIALLFYKSIAELQARNVDNFLSGIPDIVDGKATPARGTFHVFTTQEFVDLSKREVRWKMPKALAAKMKRERWSMILFRTDFHCSTTEACPAGSWLSAEAHI